ncbi:hypothetical protein RAS2_35660 [Phycisphaerae bacterium RAS2]|nr:hypothetical protein RAS2_35660 [Phycisphaerae bacterium RAS2]
MAASRNAPRQFHPIHVLLCLVASAAWLAALPSRAADCSVTTVNRTPLNDLGAGLYLGQFQGGLYPNGMNALPTAHGDLGAARAAGIRPLNLVGQPSPSGRVVLVSVGMSNTSQEFTRFIPLANGSPDVNHTTLAIVNGAQGGQDAADWEQPTMATYDTLQARLQQAGLSEAQVQAVWLKQANAGPASALPAANSDAYSLLTKLGNIVRAIRVRYPNIRVVFLSSRIYAGYASTTLNPEPYSYEYGFSVKWLIEAQATQMAGGGIDPRAGDLDANSAAPWLAWGPYLWADGLTPRSDGLIWQCSDLNADGTHPSTVGADKVAGRLLNHLLASPFSRGWFGIVGLADIDRDGDADSMDDSHFVSILLSGNPTPDQLAACDLNGDGRADGADLRHFLRARVNP